jgi:hypothetical protein
MDKNSISGKEILDAIFGKEEETLTIMDMRIDQYGNSSLGFADDMSEEMTDAEFDEIIDLMQPICNILQNVINRVMIKEVVQDEHDDVPFED